MPWSWLYFCSLALAHFAVQCEEKTMATLVMGVFRERAGCSWFSEAIGDARSQFPADAAYHDKHGDDLTKCDSWLCVCGHTDSRGGSWETCDETGAPMEPTNDWPG